MSLPVSSLSTAFIISTGKQRLVSCLGGSFICTTVAHERIASCETDREFGFLLRFLVAGPSGGSTLGAGGTGVPGGATLGGLGVFAWGATLESVAGKTSLGSLCGVWSPYSNLSVGGSIVTGSDRGG